MNCFNWVKREQWHRELSELLNDHLNQSVIEEFQLNPPTYIVADDLGWLNRIVKKVNGKSISMKQVATDRMKQHYDRVLAFHGCRPLSLESYRQKGVLICNPEDLQKEARGIFANSKRLEAALAELNAPNSKSNKIRGGKLYFCLTLRDLVEFCGHYMSHGSEYLQMIGNMIGEKEALNRRGKATVIECSIPSLLIRETDWEGLAGFALKNLFEAILDPDLNDRFTNFAFTLLDPLPPECIIRFHHPKNQESG